MEVLNQRNNELARLTCDSFVNWVAYPKRAPCEFSPINLTSTPVSDAGLRALHQCCPRLCWLRLSGTGVTQDGVYDLLSRRPNLSIVV